MHRAHDRRHVLNPGTRLHTYRIARSLPATRTGLCFEATHVVLPRRALVKVAHGPDRAAAAMQLLREGCILDALQHAGVPRIYDADLLPDRRPWFAREWLDGETVPALLAHGAVDAAVALSIVRDVAETLAYVHHRGIIHGDLHPEAVLVTPGRAFGVMIIDWSDASTHDSVMPMHAGSLAGQGAPHVAPELRRGDAIDDRADVFALGALAARLLPRIASPGVRRLVDQMLAPDRFDRPSAAEVCAELTDHVDVTHAVDAIDEVAVSPRRHAAATPAVQVHAHARIRRPRWTPPIPMSQNIPLDDLTDALEDLAD